ncbi:transposase family protein, partial [Moorena sp. SIO3I8]|uniref:transposase family protein n=1 Tax=Moorena sp. SIO3I8 TaxID=2607833 RepID=UPI0013C13A96
RTSLTIAVDPVQITGRFYGLVTIIKRETLESDRFQVSHFNKEFMIDGTERLINRPKDKEDRKTYYSGLKLAHTVKNNLLSVRGGKVLFLSDTYYGLKHDLKIADEEGYRFPIGSTQWPRYWVRWICAKGGQHQATEEEATVSRTER